MTERYENYESQVEPRVAEESIIVMGEAVKQAPKITGVPTGVEGLDELFFTVEVEDGKPVKKPLGGIPTYAVFNVTENSAPQALLLQGMGKELACY